MNQAPEILRIDFVGKNASKYFHMNENLPDLLIKDPEAYTVEEKIIVTAVQKEQLNIRVVPFKDMTYEQKLQVFLQVMDKFDNMIIYEKLAEKDGVNFMR